MAMSYGDEAGMARLRISRELRQMSAGPLACGL